MKERLDAYSLLYEYCCNICIEIVQYFYHSFFKLIVNNLLKGLAIQMCDDVRS